MSMYADPSGERSRNVSALPTFQPLASSFLFLVVRIVIILKPSLAGLNDLVGSFLSFLLKHLANDYGVIVKAVYYSPDLPLVCDA